MTYIRFSLFLVLFAVAAPTFAICGLCDEYANCNYVRAGYGCHYRLGQNCTIICVEMLNTNCNPTLPATFSSTYQIKSVTVFRATAVPAAQQPTLVTPQKTKRTT